MLPLLGELWRQLTPVPRVALTCVDGIKQDPVYPVYNQKECGGSEIRSSRIPPQLMLVARVALRCAWIAVRIPIITRKNMVDVRYACSQSGPKVCRWQFVSLLCYRLPG